MPQNTPINVIKRFYQTRWNRYFEAEGQDCKNGSGLQLIFGQDVQKSKLSFWWNFKTFINNFFLVVDISQYQLAIINSRARCNKRKLSTTSQEKNLIYLSGLLVLTEQAFWELKHISYKKMSQNEPVTHRKHMKNYKGIKLLTEYPADW